MRLRIDVISAEELFGPLPDQRFHLIHELAPAVVPPPGISLGVFVGEHRSGSLQHSLADEVFRGYQFQGLILPARLSCNGPGHFRVYFMQ